MGGMAAQIPIKNDPSANEQALARVRQDKLREVKAGHDGTWVAHPGLVPVAKEVFDAHMPDANQLNAGMEGVQVTAADLLQVPEGDITDDGLRLNVNVGIQYLESWLGGNGCVPIYNLMEDAATAEISRAQVWQWVRHGVKLADGRAVDTALVRKTIEEELRRIETTVGNERFAHGNYRAAADLFADMMTKPDLDEFMTIRAYEYIN